MRKPGGGPMFARVEQVMRSRLCAAFPVLLWLIADPEHSLDQVLRLSLFEHRQRKISRKKPALIAIFAAVQPQTQSERKACSGLAAILKNAILLRVRPNDFAEWVNRRPIAELRAEG